MSLLQQAMTKLGLINDHPLEPEIPSGWTSHDHKQLYQRLPNIAGELPWMSFDAENGLIELESGIHAGAMFELTPVATDGLSELATSQIHKAIHEAIKESVPEDAQSPWVAQYFVFDEASLMDIYNHLLANIPDERITDPFVQQWTALLRQHFNQVVNPSGVFIDPATNMPWRGKRRKVYTCIYHRGAYKNYTEAADELTDVAFRFESAILQTMAKIRRCTGNDLIMLMHPWLSPNPSDTDGSPYRLIEELGLPDEMHPENLPAGHNLVDACLHGRPESTERGTWRFQDVESVALPVQEFTSRPAAGHLTGERKIGDQEVALFDLLPEHTRIATTIIVQSQHVMDMHLEKITEASVGSGHAARAAKRQADAAREACTSGEKIYPMAMTVYVRESDPGAGDLDSRIKQVQSVLRPHGIKLMSREEDLTSLHGFIQGLPFCFDPRLDQKYTRRARLSYAADIAALSPLFGRSTGTGSPGLLYFNRGAEALTFDPIKDREKAAHMGVLGPTGAGKTAWLVNALSNMLAVHDARLFIIDPKWPAPSFRLFIEFCKHAGKSINRITLNPNSDIVIPPFFHATGLVDESGKPITDEVIQSEEEDLEAEFHTRDLLGEMMLLAKAMITEGNSLSRADTTKLQSAILRAAAHCKLGKTKASHVLPADVADALRVLATEQTDDANKTKLNDMAAAMDFWSQGLAGKIFGREGQPIQAADVTLVELGVLANEGNEDQMTLAFMSVMQHIQSVVSAAQGSNRPTIVVADELHVLAKNPFLGPFILKIVKVWRSLGAWFWAATQNVDDMDEGMKKLISNMEWFIALSMPKDEVAKLKAFKEISDEAEMMIRSAKKSPGRYAEGVVISPSLTTLFRGVVPPIALALAQTEQHERHERIQLVKSGAAKTELDAAFLIADQISAKRDQIDQGDKRSWIR